MKDEGCGMSKSLYGQLAEQLPTGKTLSTGGAASYISFLKHILKNPIYPVHPCLYSAFISGKSVVS
jgi:hypothetical protein